MMIGWCSHAEAGWKVFQGMLGHTLFNEVEHLDGLYQQAFNRICNQVASSITST